MHPAIALSQLPGLRRGPVAALAGEPWREFRAAPGREGALRPQQPVPDEPEHPAAPSRGL